MTADRKILFLFDVDGTLTKPRQAITDDMCQFLERILAVNGVTGGDCGATTGVAVTMAVVGGSDLDKIKQQLTSVSARSVMPLFRYVFAENGLVALEGGQQIGCASLVNQLGDEFLQTLINFVLQYLSTVQLPLKRGNFIEFRKGMINISPIGRSCSQQERDDFAEYDKRHGVREQLVKALQHRFADSQLTMCIGGQISVDVFPRGWDKTYALKFIKQDEFNEIHFFGDRTAPGGNDHAIYMDPRTIGHAVVDPSDTQRQVSELLGLKSDY